MCNARKIGPWLGAVLAAAASLGAAMLQAAMPPLKLFAASDAVRVFEDGYGTPGQLPAEVRVFGLRNEVISAQCVLRADEDLHAATVSVGPLRRADGDAIAAENVLWNFVESIFIEKNTPKLRESDLVRPAPARFPDCLSEARHVSLAKGSQKAVYLTVRIPSSAGPGEYRAEITARSATAVARLPLSLTVYPLVLPDDRHVMATEWFSTHQFQRWHGIDSSDSPQFWHMLGVYAQNMADHRQNVFRLSLGLIRTTLAADGKLRYDFSQFDRWAKVFWDTGRMDLLETGFVAEPGKGGWSSAEIRLSDFDVKDASTGKWKRLSGREYLPQFLAALVEHLREKGWLEKTVFHICDEPADHNAMAWREASEFVHRCAPQLRRIDAIENPHCLGCLEVWVPKLDHLADWQEAYEAAQRRGNEMWFYTVGIFQGGSLPNKTVDVPLIESRLMHWLNYRYGLKGYLHWGFNAWTDDPIGAPGEHRGDGWHVYPKRDGLLNSLRWEQMRNGLQDYECLWLLDNEISRVKATLSPRIAALMEPPRRGMEIACQVVPAYGDCQRDPEVLYAARRQAIEETIGLAAAPRMIVQTNPVELSNVSADCRIDVHGWAEPGTSIAINDSLVPVAADGLFLQATTVSKQGTIRVEAVQGQSHKTMVRKFRVQKWAGS